MIKFMVFVKKRRDLGRAEFERHFREVHGPLVAALPGIKRYTQNILRPDGAAKSGTRQFDALAELWFEDRAAFEAAWDTPEGKRAVADNENYMDRTKSNWAVYDEHDLLG